MGGPRAVATALFLVLIALSGCGSEREAGAAGVAERFYQAAAAKDGAAACAALGEDTVTQLEKDEQKPCDEAVLALKLSGSRAAHTSVYVTSAKVDLAGGDSVFLDETPKGWRISAAGCKPEPGEEAPYDCEVES